MTAARLVDRSPELSPDELIDAMTPPPLFDEARFETYVPNPDEVEDAISYLVFGEKKAQQERFSMLKARRAAVGKRKAKLPS